jgi:hypothetical protein
VNVTELPAQIELSVSEEVIATLAEVGEVHWNE